MKTRYIPIVCMVLIMGISAVAQEEPAGPTRGERGRSLAAERRDGRPVAREEFTRDGHGETDGHMEALIARLSANRELREELSITDEQVNALKNGLFELRGKQVDTRATLEKLGLEQARLMMEAEVDEPAIMKAIDKAGRMRSELAKLRVRQLLLIKKTLTQEQIEGLRKHTRERIHNRNTQKEAVSDPVRERKTSRRDRDSAAPRDGRGDE